MLETRGTNLLKVMLVAQTHGLVACGTVALWHCGTVAHGTALIPLGWLFG